MEYLLMFYIWFSYLFVIGYLMNKPFKSSNYIIWLFSPIVLPTIFGYELGNYNKSK
jgi:hypothetical protein